MSKKSLFRGLTIVSTFLLSASIVSANVMEFYRDGMDQTFKTVSSKIVTEESENAEDAWNYDSQFKSAKDAFEGYKEFGLRSSEETAVLLKNKDKALPLTESTPKVTMLGLRSYAAVYGNSGGSIADKASIDSGNTITEAFQKSGFELNPKTLAAYKKYCEDLTWGGNGFGAIPPEYKEITTTTNIPELSPTELRGLASDYDEDYAFYGDAAIVVVGRPAGEGKNYNDGAKFLNEFTEYIRREYPDMIITIDLLSGTINGKTTYGIQYKYTVNGRIVIDNRYAIVINNKVYMMGSKEENVNSAEINKVVENVIATFTEGGK